MNHELRNYSKKTLKGYCLTCNGIVDIKNRGKEYLCFRTPEYAIPQIPKKEPKPKKKYVYDQTYKHGLKRSEADAMKAINPCAICGETDISKLCIDHCHKTLIIRGVLCNDCNLGIGRFKDNPDLLVAAAKYLKG